MRLRLSREEFHRWAEGQTGRYERVAGEPVAMSPKRIEHVRIKNRVWAALDRAVREGGLDCEALGDGVTIEVDAETDYEPDAVVKCGPRLPPDATAAAHPGTKAGDHPPLACRRRDHFTRGQRRSDKT